MRKLKLSIVGYLNALPLSWGFIQKQAEDAFDLDFSPPSLCADQIASGSVDIGLIPTIEYQRIQGLKIIPDLAVAAKKSVRSVLLVSKIPVQQVKSIALDHSSRTSVVLLQILLQIRFNSNPILSLHEPVLSKMLMQHDAALLIGDAALTADIKGLHRYDLSEAWRDETGKPFVFAFWAARADSCLTDCNPFYESYCYGRTHMEEIVSQQSQKLGLPYEQVLSYLTECIDYSLDKENLEGLQLFYNLAKEFQLMDNLKELDLIRP